MRDYGKVVPRFWTGGSGRQLRGQPDAQVLALYLMSAPASTATGLYILAIPTMVHETGLGELELRAALAVLEREGVAYYDEGEDLVWVPQMARIQIGETLSAGDRRRPWVRSLIEPHKSHRFARQFLSLYEGAYKLTACPIQTPISPIEGASKGDTMPPRSQDQDQDQEQEQDQDTECSATGTVAEPDSPTVLTFPCRGRQREWRLTAAHLASLAADYPGLDVEAEARKAHAWAISNPGKQKTARGAPAFLANWLARATDRQGGLNLPRIATAPSSTPRLMTAHD